MARAECGKTTMAAEYTRRLLQRQPSAQVLYVVFKKTSDALCALVAHCSPRLQTGDRQQARNARATTCRSSPGGAVGSFIISAALGAPRHCLHLDPSSRRSLEVPRETKRTKRTTKKQHRGEVAP